MLEKAIEKILSLGEIRTVEIDGQTYVEKGCINPVIKMHDRAPEPLTMHTLSGLRSYIIEGVDSLCQSLIVHVLNHGEVRLYGPLIPKAGNIRHHFATVKLMDQSFRFGYNMDLEMFVISIQSMFVQDKTTESILSVVGNLANELITTSTDNGLSQSVQIKTGITTKSNVKVVNPVTLRPYRTFREIEQPASECILRFSNKGGFSVSLYESDGEKWKLDAVVGIKKYFIEALKGSGIEESVSVLG